MSEGRVIGKEIGGVATGKCIYDLVGPGMDLGFYLELDEKRLAG